MQLFMNITPYTVISIETLLFGSDNLTDENNLIVFRNVHKYIQTTSKFKQHLRANLFKVSNYYMLVSRTCNTIHHQY